MEIMVVMPMISILSVTSLASTTRADLSLILATKGVALLEANTLLARENHSKSHGTCCFGVALATSICYCIQLEVVSVWGSF